MKFLSNNNAIIYSLIIHGVLFCMVIFHVNDGASKKQHLFEDDLVKQKVMIAQLTITTPKLIDESDKKQNENTIEEESTEIESTETKNTEKEKDEKEIKTALKESTIDNVKRKEDPQQSLLADKHQEIEDKRQEPITNDNKIVAIKKSIKPTVTINALEISRQFINKQIEQPPVYHGATAKGGMSEMNKDLPVHNYKYTEKSIEEKRVIKTSCDSTVKKSLATISYLLGGRIKCETGPDLSQFIKKRQTDK